VSIGEQILMVIAWIWTTIFPPSVMYGPGRILDGAMAVRGITPEIGQVMSTQ
jgi:hypothetical protein